ncbi:hypothetical protein ACWCPK_38235 [Streptomyces sp. NPDC001953]
MKMPRVTCRVCRRAIAAGPVAGRPTKGRLWRHDPPQMRAQFGNSLVSCAGSLAIVDLPVPGEQLQISVDDLEETGDVEAMALF